MRFFILTILFISSNLNAKTNYQEFLKKYPVTTPRLGSWKDGEIEIATTSSEIARIQKHCFNKLIKAGHTKEEAQESSRIGVISEDHYWIWVRDAVIFPGGILGSYDRIIWKTGLSGPSGVAILPLLPNKKIVFNINFRHATRTWELELPRGGRIDKETPEQAAFRELKEETGCLADKLTLLGHLAPDSGMITGTVPVYLGNVRETKERHQDESEAIVQNIELTLDEVQRGFVKGYLIVKIKNKDMKVYCRDPFTSYAIMQATWRKLL